MYRDAKVIAWMKERWWVLLVGKKLEKEKAKHQGNMLEATPYLGTSGNGYA